MASHLSGDPAEATTQVAISKPKLQIESFGPALSFVDRESIFEIRVRNTGNANATNVRLSNALPAGVRLTVVGRPVQYDRNTRTLVWDLQQLAVGEEQRLRYKAITTNEGRQSQAIQVTAAGGWTVNDERITQVMSRANLNVAVKNINGPVEVRQPTEFSVLISNDGSKLADNVRVSVRLADGLEPVVSDDYTADETSLVFPSVKIEAGQQQTMQFKLIGHVQGEHIVKVTIESGARSQRLTTETTAFIYGGDGEPMISSKQRGGDSLPPVLDRPL